MLETHATLRQTKQIFAQQESQNEEYSQIEKPILPGSYHEDAAEEKMKMIVPTKYKDKHTRRDETLEKTEIKLREAEDKSKEKIKSIFKSTKNKDYQKIKSMECNLDERLSIMDRGLENEPQEEVEGDQEVETQEQEQGPSIEALSNQIKLTEPKSLAWYLDKAIKENKEWATFDPKKWEEWINRNLPPSSEYEEYVKKNP
ncbi:hypothetical protein O181_071895 [Austropuccinia psidii MF-1]|uniref:Uncharacterized protein n=1 Tax=Austropuccinia psidii MF-1 TaxID=1389203 RepID=A0A9Q3IAH0_9BASI|nr:hypothetical protein [Austropuccinia psidii MF-1]